MNLAFQYVFPSEKSKYCDAISILYNFSRLMSRNKLRHDENLLIVEFLTFDELRLLYLSHTNLRYLRTAFESRTDSVPWILNIVVKIPLGLKGDYIYRYKDIMLTVINVGNFSLYLSDFPVINITSEYLDSVRVIKEKIGNEIILRGKKECLKIIVMRGIGGKIALSSYYPRDLNIPLSMNRIKGKDKCSIRGKKVTIKNILFDDTSMIDETYFSKCKLRATKPRCG
uniref:Uncharacterized protein n=1 Tax=Pithovirus LCPAC406 TaxID=2506599 RepID=A0A481ZDS2_9VIRU|nr:MAG: uncharacterized protein LCPAC406_02510 [Pithovirus LCPAC406]